MQLRQFVHAVAVQNGFEHEGNQHRVVERRHMNAALGEHQVVVFHVLRDLQHARIFQQRLQMLQHFHFRQLHDLGRVAQVEPVGRAVRTRNVASLVRRHAQADAAQSRLHRIERGRLGVHGHLAGLARPRDPAMQALQGRNCFIAVVIDGLEQCAPIHHRAERACDSGQRFSGALGAESLARRGQRFLGGIGSAGDTVRIVDPEMRGGALGQGIEFHQLQESDQWPGFRLIDAEFGQLFADRHVCVERHQPLGHAREIRVFDQRLAPLGLLDLAGAA